ncbi:MAG: isoprenylcysteine carboxylmethyltransferase family protein [Gammaproteobacteria bacterium]
MNISSHDPAAARIIIILLAWVAFAVVFLLRRRAPREATRKRLGWSWAAILLQGYAIGLVWAYERPHDSALLPWGRGGEWVLAGVVLFLSVVSVGFVATAVCALGKQWSLEARVRDDHELITAGPYGYVRHPIYTGLFGLLIATGLALSLPLVLVAAMAIFFLATRWRIALEERLLRERFGNAYVDYAANVPAFIPWRLSRRSAP